MKLAPAQWKGSAQKLIDEVLRPWFVDASKVSLWQDLLSRRLAEDDPLYLIAATTADQRSRWGQEKIMQAKNDARVIFGDRAPATAVITYLMEVQNPSVEKMSALLMHLPQHVFDLDRFTRWAALTNNIASAGWMTSHVFSEVSGGANWESLSKDELRKRMIRNLHPMNIFIFPNLNKSGTVYADDPRFHALIAAEYKKKYGALYDQYLALTGDNVSKLPAAEDFEIDFAAGATAPGGVKMDSKDLITKIEPTGAFDLKLITIAEGQGYQSRSIDPSAMTRGFFDMKLEFKPKAGEVSTVGYFRLNLKDLYEKKFISRDAKGLKLMVHKTADSGYAVGPKKNGPLSPLPA